MTTENPSTIEQLKKKLAQLEQAAALENFHLPEEWGTAELARFHARRLSIHRMELLYLGRAGWSTAARILEVEIFLRELGGEK